MRGGVVREKLSLVVGGLGLVVVLGLSLHAAPAGAVLGSEKLDADARVNEANSMLGDDSRRGEAAALYRSVLEDDPDHVEARLWLARLLSWDGVYDESLAHYRVLIAKGVDPVALKTERAEVLSWAGRYPQAEAEFEVVLREDPDNFRAAAGLARVFNWSGRPYLAVQAYQRALAIEDDRELRAEYESLRDSGEKNADAASRWFRDSDDYEYLRVGVSGGADLGFTTRLLYDAGYTRVSRERAAGDARKDESQGVDLLTGLEYDFTDRLVGRVLAGFSYWDEGDTLPWVRAGADFTLDAQTALGFELEYGSFLSRSDSIDVVLEGIDQVTLRGTVWRGITEKLSSFVYLDTTFVGEDSEGSDNTRIAVGASLSYEPSLEVDARVGIEVGYLTYLDEATRFTYIDPATLNPVSTSIYYAPETDLGATLFGEGSLPLAEWLELRARAGIGGGYAEESGNSSSGFSYDVSGGPRFMVQGWWLGIEGYRSESIRSTTYTSEGFGVSAGKSF